MRSSIPTRPRRGLSNEPPTTRSGILKTLQKRYTKQHNGTACEYVELALDALRAPERIEHENKSLRHFIEANASKLAAELACLTAELSALKSERDRFKARAEAAERDINRMLRSDETEDFCVFCKCFKDRFCACSTGAEWRGPQEGANT